MHVLTCGYTQFKTREVCSITKIYFTRCRARETQGPLLPDAKWVEHTYLGSMWLINLSGLE